MHMLKSFSSRGCCNGVSGSTLAPTRFTTFQIRLTVCSDRQMKARGLLH